MIWKILLSQLIYRYALKVVKKKGRTSKDAAKFGIGYYHGASMSIIRAQDQANDKLSFDEIEQIMEKRSKESADIIKYIKEVYGEN